jgi:Fe-S cluster assembly ATP-binding protein
MYALELENFSIFADKKQIVKEVSFKIKPGEVHLIMGQNGSGKSTLLNALAGHPKYSVQGKAKFFGEDLMALKPHERARKGIFLAFQNPIEVPGVSIFNFLKRALSSKLGKEISVSDFEKIIYEKMDLLGIERSFALRGVNEGFSGGERKKSEVLQLAVLEPKLVMLDELDSGLDIDAVNKTFEMLAKMKRDDMSMLIVTHYARILKNLKPDFVHVMRNGEIILSGTEELALKLEEKGYAWVENR